MGSNPILRNGAQPDRITSTNTVFSTPSASRFQGTARLCLIERSVLEQANTRTRRICALAQDYVRPASLDAALQQGTMLPTDGAAIILGIKRDALRKSRQREAGPAYYRYGPRGPVLYSLQDLMLHKTGTPEPPFTSQSEESEQTFFSRRGAAIILGVSVALLKHWRQRDVGPRYFQFGYKGRILYKLSDLNNFKAECHVVPGLKG